MTRQTTHEEDRPIHTSDAQPGDVLIQLTHPRSNTYDGQLVELSVQDRMSGETLVRVTLNAEQFTEMMSTSAVRVGGAQITPNPQRLGKRSQNTFTSLGHSSDRSPEQVRDEYLAEGWERVRIDRQNYGHRVVAYRWIDDEEHEE